MSRRYALYDSAQMGDNLEVTRGGIVLTTDVPSLSIARTARLSVPALDFESAAQFTVYGKAGTPIAGKVSIGVVTADAALDDYVGSDEHGLGYRVGDGGIYHNGTNVEPTTTGTLGDVVTVRFLPNGSGSGTVTFYLNGDPIDTVALPSTMEGVPLYLGVSLGSTIDAGDIQVLVNSGQDWYEFPIDGNLGWWDVPAVPSTLQYADLPYITHRDDAIPYSRYEGGMRDDRIDDDRGVHYWIWGRDKASTRASAAVVNVIDSVGYLDNALGGVYRDQPARLKLVDSDGSFDNGFDMGGYIVDSIVATGPLSRRITLKGPLAQFEVPMLRRQVRPDADPDAVGHYYPMLIGPAFSCPVRLLTKADRIYALDGVGTNAVSKVRDNGRALDVSVIPPDWTLLPAGREIQLQNEPFGTVTADAAGTGAGYIPPLAPDVLNGSGTPFTAVDPPLDLDIEHWVDVDVVPGFSPQVETQNNREGWARFYSPEGWGKIKHESAVLTAGRTYRWEITVNNIRQHAAGDPPIIVGFTSTETSFTPPWWSANGRMAGLDGLESGGIIYRDYPRTFSGLYTPESTHPVLITWRDYGINAPSLISLFISNVSFLELPEPEDDTEDEADAAVAALARPLEDMLRQGIEERCSLSPDLWDADSAADIDDETGWLGQGYWAHEQVKLLDYVDDLMPAYLASAFEAGDGRLSVARLRDPDVSPLTGVDIGPSDIINDPQPEWDDMPGLSVSIGCRKNEHVFSADELSDALPWAARPKLTNPYRYVRRYGGPLAPGLEHARAADLVDSRLVIPEEAQEAIDYVGKLAQKPRAFFRKIHVPNAGRWEPGQVVRMYLPRWFKDNGGWRNVFIVRVQDSRRDFGYLDVWCTAPWSN